MSVRHIPFLLVGTLLFSCAKGSANIVSAPVADASSVIQAVLPMPGSDQAPVASKLLVNFSAPLDPESFHTSNLGLFVGSNQVESRVEHSANQARLIPVQPLRSNTTYTAVLFAPVKMQDGRLLQSDYIWQFSTEDILAPVVIATSPIPGMQFGNPSVVEATFSEEIDPTTVNDASFLLSGPHGPVVGDVTCTGKVVKFSARDAIESSSPYSARLTTQIHDLAGNALANDYTWNFTSSDLDPPVVISTMPANGDLQVELRPTIRIVFSEQLNPESIDPSVFSLTDEFGTSIPGTLTYSAVDRSLTYALDSTGTYSRLALGVNYTIGLTTQIQDLNGGNPMQAPFHSTFRVLRNAWAGPEVLEDLPEDADGLFATYDPSRNAFHAIWKQKGEDSSVYNEMRHHGIGRYFELSNSYELLDDTANAMEPGGVAADTLGNVFVVWWQRLRLETSQSVVCARLPAGAPISGWTPATNEEIDGGPDGTGDGAVIATGPNGEVYAGWTTSNDIFVSRYLNGTWSVPQVIDNHTGNVASLRMAVNSQGAALATWTQQYTTSAKNVMFNFKRAEESSWTASRSTVVDSGSGSFWYSLQMAPLSNGDVVLVWPRLVASSPSNKSMQSKTVTPNYSTGAVTVGPLSDIDNDSSTAAQSADYCNAAVGPDDSVYVVFEQRVPATSSNSSLLMRRRAPSGNWDPIQAADYFDLDGDSAATQSFTPVVGVDSSGKVLVAWKQGVFATHYNIVSRFYQSGSWSNFDYPDFDGSASASDADSPVLAVDAAGLKFQLIWRQLLPGDTTFSVVSNRFE